MANENEVQEENVENAASSTVELDEHSAELQLHFNNDVPTRDCGFKGVCIDNNQGLRIYNPDGNNPIRCVAMDDDSCCIICDVTVNPGDVTMVNRKYYINTSVKIEDTVTKETFDWKLDLRGQNVMIRFPQSVMGDVLSWFPYAEEFRKVHECEVYVDVSDRMRDLFEPVYTNLHYISCDEKIDTIATYYMGIFFPTTDRVWQPCDFRFYGLGQAAPHILGLPDTPIRPKVYTGNGERKIKEKYVCIATQATTQAKYWNNLYGWPNTIEYLKEKGYRVLCIDRDKYYGMGRFQNAIPRGCEDFTGSLPLTERAELLAHADFFIGLPSGLSWLAHACGIPVIMIAGFSLPMTEFPNPYRIINYNACTGCWNYDVFDHKNFGWCPNHSGTDREFECSRLISPSAVNKMIDRVIADLEAAKAKEDH